MTEGVSRRQEIEMLSIAFDKTTDTYVAICYQHKIYICNETLIAPLEINLGSGQWELHVSLITVL